MTARREAPVHAVIGAGYGDEGKGLATDALASRYGDAAVVVRANSGAQAGHTVVAPDGRRHVFHHIGSGSFAGSSTFLGRRFVSNPMLLGGELAELALKDVLPRVVADSRGLATTPYDVMLNQFVEQDRAGGRHGSCGIGFGETIERNLKPEFAFGLDALRDPAALAVVLDRIRREWVPARAARLGVPLDAERLELIGSDAVLRNYLDDAAAFLAAVDLVDGPRALPVDAPLIFENAQGLLLDQDRGVFPHVTRSNTGLKNVVEMSRELDVDRIDVLYATRAYVTRHGAGPLAGELAEKPWPGISDRTNVPNPWQGTLRFALLDLDVLGAAIGADLQDAADVAVSHSLLVTCLDQIDGPAQWTDGGAISSASPEALVQAAARRVEAGGSMVSTGPTRDHVSEASAIAAA
ncbi:adenylosuccinate synthetase [Methylobacterium radiotolerans]|uniref:adenylosuccinate synthetase n=1 Tax=Methylobacterium radiotolerans TaxID=31998 RepID=UPI0038D1B722